MGQRIALLLQGRAVIAAQDELINNTLKIDSNAIFFYSEVFLLPISFHRSFIPSPVLLTDYGFCAAKTNFYTARTI